MICSLQLFTRAVQTGRIRVIRFETEFKEANEIGESQPNHRVLDKSLDGKIPTWKYAFMGRLIQGYKAWKEEGGLDSPPEGVKLATEEYKQENNPLMLFINAKYDLTGNQEDQDGWQTPEGIHREYTEWAKVRGVKELSAQKLGREMTEAMKKGMLKDIVVKEKGRKRGGENVVYYKGLVWKGGLAWVS